MRKKERKKERSNEKCNRYQPFVEVVVQDGESFLSFSHIFETEIERNDSYLDLTKNLSLSLSSSSHFIEQQVVQVCKKAVTFPVGSATTGKFSVLDTFETHFEFAKTMRSNQPVEPFSILKRWHALSSEEKCKQVEQCGSWDLFFFIKMRDKVFFDSVLLSHLRNKLKERRKLMDFFLLDLDAIRFFSPSIMTTMNSMELCLLAVNLFSFQHVGESERVVKLLSLQREKEEETKREKQFKCGIAIKNFAPVEDVKESERNRMLVDGINDGEDYQEETIRADTMMQFDDAKFFDVRSSTVNRRLV